MIGLPYAEESVILSRFDMIPERDRRMQADRIAVVR